MKYKLLQAVLASFYITHLCSCVSQSVNGGKNLDGSTNTPQMKCELSSIAAQEGSDKPITTSLVFDTQSFDLSKSYIDLLGGAGKPLSFLVNIFPQSHFALLQISDNTNNRKSTMRLTGVDFTNPKLELRSNLSYGPEGAQGNYELACTIK